MTVKVTTRTFQPASRKEALARIRQLRDDPQTAQAMDRDFRGVSLVGEDLHGLDLSGCDFTAADLTGANLAEARLFRAVFNHASLVKAVLSRAEMAGADLTGANLEDAICENTGFGMAKLDQARLFQARLNGATLTKSSLKNTDLRCAHLQHARLRETDLSDSDLTGADLFGADLSLSQVQGAIFDNAILRDARLRNVRHFTKAHWIGVDIRDINFAGAYRLRRFVVDQNYLKEFRESSRLAGYLYYAWRATSNCGESILRWLLWIVGLTVLFAWIYTFTEVDYHGDQGFLAALYYSVVTVTTLGYGDIVPVSPMARTVAMIQVLTGYIMLGGLLTIFNNKMARRGE